MSPQHRAFHRDLLAALPAAHVVTDPLRTLAYGTDASFYRLIPQVVVFPTSEQELIAILALAARHDVALTFRAAGTSLSGQAISDSVLVVVHEGWTALAVLDGGARIRLQPGVIGLHANAALRRYGRKIGPDPASLATARIGGIVANNSSGMCCGVAQNSYHTLSDMRLVLSDGTVLDTSDPTSISQFRMRKHALLEQLATLAATVRADTALAQKIRRKFRLKNTTGYGINALLDFDDPIEMLTHLMIGSEGTLGFISAVTYRTVVEHEHKASCLVRFDSLADCCRAVAALSPLAAADAVELLDRRSMLAVRDEEGLPPFMRAEPAPDAAVLLIEVRGCDAANLAQRCALVTTTIAQHRPSADSGFSRDPSVCHAYWHMRKGLFPAVGGTRPVGTACVIEDVAFPVERLADGVHRLTKLFERHRFDEALIFGHALEGNLHFVFTPSFENEADVRRYSAFMDDVCTLVAIEYGGSLKAEHGTGRNIAPYVRLEWGDDAYAVMLRIKKLLDPRGLLNPDVVISTNPHIHLENLKRLPPADPLVDRCIECGFCEPVCPSSGLSLTPRQRIVAWREIQHLRRAGSDSELLSRLEQDFQWAGLDTCAATGMCATRCPVHIDTGELVRQLRGPVRHPRIAAALEHRLSDVLDAARIGLRAYDTTRRIIGAERVEWFQQHARRVIPIMPWVPPTMPRAAKRLPSARAALESGEPVVYFGSCVNRLFAESTDQDENLAATTLALLGRAGFAPRTLPHLESLCCGQPFASKGAADAAQTALERTAHALLQASDTGRIPIYLDNAPCALRLIEAQRMQQIDSRLQLWDSVSFLADRVSPQVTVQRALDHVAVHVPCSTAKLGCGEKLIDLAKQCAVAVTVPDIACCGFAGDKGFTLPELNANALRSLRTSLPATCTQGVSCSKTCQIGLHQHSGIPYRSIESLLYCSISAQGK